MPAINSTLIVGKKESVVDEYLLLNPLTIPMLTEIGFGSPVYNTLHEWVEDEMFEVATTIAAELAEGATEIAVASGKGTIFRPDHIVRIDDELIKVTGVATDTLTIVRGFGDTTDTTHASGSDITIEFTEGTEGRDARNARYKPRVAVNNRTQIFDDTISISGTTQEVAQYGVNSEYFKERTKVLINLFYQLERALINGVGHVDNLKRSFKGIRSFIATNVHDANNTDLSKNFVNEMVQSVYDAGGLRGGNYKFVVSTRQKRKAGELDQASLMLNRADRARGESVDTFVTDLGEFPIVTNPNLRPSEIIFTDFNRQTVRPLGNRGFFHEFLGKVGDKIEGMIIGEYTYQFEQEKAHARAINLKV